MIVGAPGHGIDASDELLNGPGNAQGQEHRAAGAEPDGQEAEQKEPLAGFANFASGIGERQAEADCPPLTRSSRSKDRNGYLVSFATESLTAYDL